VDERTHDLKEDVTLISNAVSDRTVVSKAHQRPEYVSMQFALRDGTITDYPFDRYTANFYCARSSATLQISAQSRSGWCSTTLTPSSSSLSKQEKSIQVHQDDGEAKTITTPQALFAATAKCNARRAPSFLPRSSWCSCGA
jgi:hypothetical protein